MPSNIETSAGRGVGATGARESTTSIPSWLRLLIPSVTDLFFVLLLVPLTVGPLAKGLLGDAGIGWHIRTGEWILKAHAVPRVDLFSSVMQGKPWYAWEWLYDAIVAGAHHALGLNGVVLLSALVIVLTFTLVLRRMLKNGTNLPVAVVMVLLAVAASTVHFLARPHVLSWLLTVLWFGVLEDFETDGKWRRLLWLPGLTVLWVNLHGGFLVGFVLLGTYLLSALISGWVSRAEEQHKTAQHRAGVLAGIGIACGAGTLINPYGYELHVHIYQYLSDRFLMDHIDEFLSPSFHGLPQKCFAGMVLLALLALGAARKRVGVSHVLLILFAVYSGLYATRNIPVSSMLLALVVAPRISAVMRELAGDRDISESLQRWTSRFDSFGVRMAGMDSKLRGHLWPVLALLVLLWVCGHQGYFGGRRLIDAQFEGMKFPVQAAGFLAASGSREPVFCVDRWGGYLIYRLYPQTRVAVDDRHDLYGTEFLKRYLKVVRGEPGWEQALGDMHPGWVLVPKDSALASLLAESAKWKAVYGDETGALFQPISRIGDETSR